MQTTESATTIETIQCPCGTTFQWDNEGETKPFWLEFKRPSHCGPCQAEIDIINEREHEEQQRRKREAELESAKARAEQRIREITPPRFRNTDIAHPDFNLDLWNQIKAWRPGDEVPFIGTVGTSGGSKTRIGFLKLHQLVMEAIRPTSDPGGKCWIPTFAARTAGDFAGLVGRQFISQSGVRDLYDRDPKAAARRDLDGLHTAHILFLDDLGKARNTPSVSSELFSIIDHRHAHNLPTIWTANLPPEEIVRGMPEDIGGPLAGRLIECSNIITI